MSFQPWTHLLLGLLAALFIATPATARHRSHSHGGTPATYTLIKAGGYGLDSIDRGDDLDSGLFIGVEAGISPSPYVDFGFSMDWFHRRRSDNDVLSIDSVYDLPIEGRLDVSGASTDLVPLGAVLRVRFPVGDGRFAPFVAGHLTYDILRLTAHDVSTVGNSTVLTERTDWFSGPGGTLSLGVEAQLDPRFALVIEAGAHGSEPSKELIVDGTPIRGHVVADGEFARFGVRMGF